MQSLFTGIKALLNIEPSTVVQEVPERSRMIAIAQEAADRMLEWFDSKFTRSGGFFNALWFTFFTDVTPFRSLV
jgi:hypothetical protein